MRLIDADALVALVQDSTILGDGFKYAFVALVKGEPTVDAVPSTDVDELKMRLIGAEAAVNGMREQINRMVIINSEKVSIVRCGECKYSHPYMLGLYRCDRTDIALATGKDEYCSRGERKEDVSN